jgi:hypothetical protein
MNADECRKKADDCLAAAQYASDRNAQRTWRHLADMWLRWSEQLDKFRAYRERSTAAANVESSERYRAAALPIANPGPRPLQQSPSSARHSNARAA